jgi:hypothetical protein
MQRLPEEPVEHRAGRAGLESGADLAEDLALAGDERVEPRGDSEEMERRRLVREAVDDRAELLHRQPADGDKGVHGAQFGIGADDVQLGAVAGREAHRLPVLGERCRQLAGLRQGNECPLTDSDRRPLVGEPDEREHHEK